VPTKTARKTRFNNQSTRQTRFTKPPAPAAAKPHAPGKNRRQPPEPKRRRNGKNAGDLAKDLATKTAADLTPSERERRTMIRDRNRHRRLPWIPAAGLLAVSQLIHWIGHLLAGAGPAPSTTVAVAAGTAPLTGAIWVLLYHRKTHLQWWPELLATGIGGAAIAGWIAVAGLSWPAALTVLVGTLAVATRWWKAHPIGPGVPRLEPAKPTSTPSTAAADSQETDPYFIAWRNNNATGEGKAKGSRLTNRRVDEFTRTYDVELKRGTQTIKHLLANRDDLAGGLGEDTERVLFKRAPRGSGAHMAVLTIITTDPTEKTRYYTGPKIERGIIKGVARFTDGTGDIDITMWDRSGTVPTMVVGSTGGGKSGAANILAVSALSTGIMNLLYADPKGNSSTAIATRARVAIIGKSNVLLAPYLVQAMTKARGELAAQLRSDLIFPSADVPGWMFLHDEYSLIASDPLCQKIWTETVNIIRAYGIWGVALNQSQGQPQWGNDHARSAWASQVIAFRVNSKSGSDLVPGLNFDPADLPMQETGRPVPGMAVHAYYDTPTRWDFLPSEADADEMVSRGEPRPPCTTTQMFDRHFNQPDLHPFDEQAITSVLGPPVNGRWQVGGLGSTHEFPEDIEELAQTTIKTAQPKGDWGTPADLPAPLTIDQLNDSQVEVLEIVHSGVSTTAEILNAATSSRTVVFEALKRLSGSGLIDKSRQGNYRPAGTEPATGPTSPEDG
jgi:hypothetical protein